MSLTAMATFRASLSRLRGRVLTLASQAAGVVADRAQRLAEVVPRVESAVQRVDGVPGVERFSAQREAFRLALAEYLIGPLAALPREPDRAVPPEGILHLTRQVETRLEQLHRHREFWRGSDPVEAVHQLRVASRRLRAFVDVFAQFLDSGLVQRTRKRLKKITRAVRDLRDADVLVIDLEQRLRRVQGDDERAALQHALKAARARRTRLAKKAATSTQTFDLDALGVALRKMLDDLALRARSPSTTYELLAELTFDRILEETRQAFPTFAHLPRPEELHAFRLRVKRLRYAAELVEPVLGERFEEIHRRAKKIQELLGAHQDRVVLGQTLDRHRRKVARDEHPTVARGLDQLVVAVRGEREQLFQRFSTEYAHGAGPKLFAP